MTGEVVSMHKRRIGISLTLAVLLLALYWILGRGPKGVLPVEPNPFVRRVAIEPLDESIPAFGDPIRISAAKGVYARVRFERFTERPERFQEREVNAPDRWPITLAIYRLGESPGQAVEFHCGRCGGELLEQSPGDDPHVLPPPFAPRIGRTSAWTRGVGYSGEPQLPPGSQGENCYWTFLTAPDRQEAVGEYVYEVWLYPTARWVSDVRIEPGEPVVLKRGILLISEASKAPIAVP